MKQVNSATARAPARIDLVGGTADIAEGVTLNMAIEGPDPTKEGGMTAWCRLTLTDDMFLSVYLDGRLAGSCSMTRDLPESSEIYPYFRLHQLLGASGMKLKIVTTIPPRSGLGGSTSVLVAVAHAWNHLKSLTRETSLSPYEIAELAQRADLRTDQVQGYQDPYAAVKGGINCLYFGGKHVGRDIKKSRLLRGGEWIYEEPFATVEPIPSEYWRMLDLCSLIAVPPDLDRISGEVNASVITRYLAGDPDITSQIGKKTQLALQAKTWLLALSRPDRRHYIVSAIHHDNQVMTDWGWVSGSRQKIVDRANRLGAVAKVCGAAGAVAIFCRSDNAERVSQVIEEAGLARVYPVHIAEGVRIVDTWPFGD